MLNEFRVQTITWDKANSRFYEIIKASEGDSNGRKLRVQILDNGKAINLSGSSLSLAWKSMTNKGLDKFDLVDANKGIFEIFYTTEMLSTSGKITASLVLVDSVGRLESDPFSISISQSIVDDDSVQSEDSFTALTEALVRVTDLEGNYAPRLNEVTAQLAQKVSHGQATLNDFDEPTRAVLQGLEPGQINAVLGEKNVRPENTTFLINTANENLFDGVYTKDRNISNGHYAFWTDGRVAIVPIEANKTYTIKKHSQSERFRLGLLVEHPGTGYPKMLEQTLNIDDTLTQYTFTNSTTARFLLVHVSSTGIEPKLKVEEGSVATGYDGDYHLSSDIKVDYPPIGIENLDFIEPVETNLFTGNYIKGIGLYTNINEVSYIGTLANGRTTIVEIEPNTKYTVTRHDTSNRFRLATFNEYPDYSNGNVDVDTSINRDDNLSSVSFLTTAESRYLAVTVSNKSEEPRLKIEKGAESTPLVTYKFSDEVLFDNGKPIERYRLADAEKMNVLDHINIHEVKNYRILRDLYHAPNTLIPIATRTHLDIYAEYDKLVTDFPEHMSMDVLGLDSWGNEIREYKYSPPQVLTNWDTLLYPSEKLEIAVLTGIHGNERGSILSALRFFNEMCYNPRDLEIMDVIKWNVDFSIVPIASPTSFDNGSRFNANGVNINRNFDASWIHNTDEGSGDSPASELETKIIQDWIESLRDVYYFIDYHVMSGDRPMGYVYDKESTTILNGLFRGLTRKWKREYPDSTDDYDFYGYVRGSIPNGDSTGFARKSGMRTITFEAAGSYPFSSDAEIVSRSDLELFANYIYTLTMS